MRNVVTIQGLEAVLLPPEEPSVEVGETTIDELKANIRFLRGRDVIPLAEAVERADVMAALAEIQGELQKMVVQNRNPYGTGIEDFDLAVYTTGVGVQSSEFVGAGVSLAFVVKGEDGAKNRAAVVTADAVGRYGRADIHSPTASALVIAHATTRPRIG